MMMAWQARWSEVVWRHEVCVALRVGNLNAIGERASEMVLRYDGFAMLE